MNKLIIGCPSKNDTETLIPMLVSLFNSTKEIDKVIIVNGGSKIELGTFFEGLPIEILDIETKTPLDAYNKLFEIARVEESDLLLTQTDVIFPKLYNRDWLMEMRLIGQEESVGAVTTWNGGKYSGPDYIDGFYWLGGWCTYYPYRTIKLIGGYDKSFPNGYGVDIDHTYRLRLNGLSVVRIDYWVDHHMANNREHDNDPKAEEMKKESSLYFKKKWGLA
jgi:hypothetical protein